MGENRYITLVREKHLLDRCADLCRYSAPDEDRVKEHDIVNSAIYEAMEAVVRVCPDPTESPGIEDVLTLLWHAKNTANGLLAVYGGRENAREKPYGELQYSRSQYGPWIGKPSEDPNNPSIWARVRHGGEDSEWSKPFPCTPVAEVKKQE